MRCIARRELPARASAWLARNQGQLDSDATLDVHKRWKSRRPTMNGNGIVTNLEMMSGARRRCMYCGDSEGCDVEHYFPKADIRWRSKVFDWGNFLWICAPCNRLKNNSFAMTADGVPLMLNPCLDRIWDFYDYVSESGYLVPRWGMAADLGARANHTINEAATRLTHEVICESRKRSERIVRRAVTRYLETEGESGDRDAFIQDVMDADHPELCEWFFSLIGSQREPFSSFVALNASLIARLREELNRHYPGVW